jgi:RimJ/RimL family protein N-acetyltransferase
MLDSSGLSFKPLARSDFPLLFSWLRNPAVVPWWDPPPADLAEVEEKHLPQIDGRDEVDAYIMTYEDEPVGFIQAYRLGSDPEYAAAVQEDPDAVGVDLYIGEDRFRHRGFGPFALRSFVHRIVFDGVTVPYCVIGPSVKNLSAIRAYEKAGFRHVKTVDVPGEDEPEYVMIMRRNGDSTPEDVVRGGDEQG